MKTIEEIKIKIREDQQISLLHMISLENYLTDSLKVKVDLVPRDSLREELKEQILREAILV